MKLVPIMIFAALLTGCATPKIVDVRKTGDAQLTCDQIKLEIAEAEDFEKKARKERTVTGTNVAAAVLFWPALVGTYANTEEAINAAKERRENMFKLASSKNCRI